MGFALNCVTWGAAACATCTVTVCGELLPPAPVATAVYAVVCVGESLMLPDAFELVVRVRIEDPAAAVIVTEVALDDCQFRVTGCPDVIDFALAVSVMVGTEFWPELETPLQELRPQRAANMVAQAMLPRNLLSIRRKVSPNMTCATEMPRLIGVVAAVNPVHCLRNSQLRCDICPCAGCLLWPSILMVPISALDRPGKTCKPLGLKILPVNY